MNKNHDAKGRFASGSSGGKSGGGHVRASKRKGAPKSVIVSKYGSTRSTNAEVAKRNFLEARKGRGPTESPLRPAGFRKLKNRTKRLG